MRQFSGEILVLIGRRGVEMDPRAQPVEIRLDLGQTPLGRLADLGIGLLRDQLHGVQLAEASSEGG